MNLNIYVSTRNVNAFRLVDKSYAAFAFYVCQRFFFSLLLTGMVINDCMWSMLINVSPCSGDCSCVMVIDNEKNASVTCCVYYV